MNLRWNPHLTFDGECEAAFRTYEKCLGGKIDFMMRYGDSPAASNAPPEWRGKIVHATFSAGDCVLTGADALPGVYRKPEGFSVLLQVSAAEDADRIFRELAHGGSVQMPLQQTFWALRFGMLTDRFGIPWLINCGNPE